MNKAKKGSLLCGPVVRFTRNEWPGSATLSALPVLALILGFALMVPQNALGNSEPEKKDEHGEPEKKDEHGEPAKKDEHAEPAKKDEHGDGHDAKPAPESTPVPRHVRLPVLKFLTAEKKSEQNFDARKIRFGVVCVLATWSRQTLNVTKALNLKNDEMSKRHVDFVGAFSHDTKEAVEKWTKSEKPRFRVGLADDAFVDALKNPKVPTCYVVNPKGEIVLRLESPSDKDLDSLFQSLTLWTDF